MILWEWSKGQKGLKGPSPMDRVSITQTQKKKGPQRYIQKPKQSTHKTEKCPKPTKSIVIGNEIELICISEVFDSFTLLEICIQSIP